MCQIHDMFCDNYLFFKIIKKLSFFGTIDLVYHAEIARDLLSGKANNL
jgi:hypothetical protein